MQSERRVLGPIGPGSTSTVVTTGTSPAHTALHVAGSSPNPGTVQAAVSSSMCIIPLAETRRVLADPSRAESQGRRQIALASLFRPSSPRTSVEGAAG